jgi:hypothetical protein
MRKFGNCANSYRYERIRQLKKSERIRILELELVRLNYEIQYLSSAISIILENNGIEMVDQLDSGKWYNRKPKND